MGVLDHGERNNEMKRWQRTIGKWTLRGLLLVLSLLALAVATLAFPDPLFAHKERFGEIRVCSNQPLAADFEDVVGSVRDRVAAMEYARPDANIRVYICGGERLYSLFARLTRQSPNSLAIGLSAFGTMYLNEAKIRRFAANSGGIRHCRYEGNVAEVIAHEVAHFNVVKRLGYRSAIRMPVWKSEGYAEYQANIAATRADDTYDFAGRVGLLLDDGFWGSGDSVARRLYRWHVLAEYLCAERGTGLEDLVDETVTEDAALRDMLAWYREETR